MPIKSSFYLGLCFRPEVSIEQAQVVKDFVSGVVQNLDVQVKKEKDEEEECILVCDKETLASEVNSGSDKDLPAKKIYTYSSEYQFFENLIYENLIISLQKIY